MFGVFPLTPAYGRVFTARAAALESLTSGQDWRCANGQYASIRDFAGQTIMFRYGKRLQHSAEYRVPQS